jgi:uncharacterized protein YbjT (DUF2867 family)
VTTRRANVAVRAELDAALAGCTHVVSLVGVLFPDGANTFHAAHADGAAHVAAAAVAAGARRLVHISAIGASPYVSDQCMSSSCLFFGHIRSLT